MLGSIFMVVSRTLEIAIEVCTEISKRLTFMQTNVGGPKMFILCQCSYHRKSQRRFSLQIWKKHVEFRNLIGVKYSLKQTS